MSIAIVEGQGSSILSPERTRHYRHQSRDPYQDGDKVCAHKRAQNRPSISMDRRTITGTEMAMKPIIPPLE
jgi:hypothetical protein